jgi:hypothetical protein
MLEFVIPVIVFSLVAAGWAGVQILAKRMGTKNHIDNQDGCCGACADSDKCGLSEAHN